MGLIVSTLVQGSVSPIKKNIMILYNPVSPAKFVISLRGNPCLRDDAASVEGQILW